MYLLSLVNFDNPLRVTYLERSFGSFYAYNRNVKHWVLDSSKTLDAQSAAYAKFGIHVLHRPGATFGARLREAMTLELGDYFLFYPDDFAWIFNYPLKQAIDQCRKHKISELMLRTRGSKWFSQPGTSPEPWFDGQRLLSSGEILKREDDLFVSRRWLMRDFHEQFSLGCNVLNTEFARSVLGRISKKVLSPGHAEKHSYIRLLFHRPYATAYYKMWTPAFHFIDLNVEGASVKNQEKAATSLIPENFAVYNRFFHESLSPTRTARD